VDGEDGDGASTAAAAHGVAALGGGHGLARTAALGQPTRQPGAAREGGAERGENEEHEERLRDAVDGEKAEVDPAGDEIDEDQGGAGGDRRVERGERPLEGHRSPRRGRPLLRHAATSATDRGFGTPRPAGGE